MGIFISYKFPRPTGMKIFLLFIISLPAFCANAQYSRIIIQFTNKDGNPYSLDKPAQFLSSRSIERRARYGISLDSTDLPVVPSYIETVKAQGEVTVLSQSKWLNQILIKTTDAVALQKIRALPFVKFLQAVALVRDPAENRIKNKFEQINETVPLINNDKRTIADAYNYGSSYNQIHIHQGEYLHNKGFSGQGMIITILDAGFNNYKTITAFDSIRLRNQVLGEKDFVDFDNSVNEDNEHGKNCLSIMAANWPGRMIGSAPSANFWLIRTEDVASEYPIEEHNWVAGAEFADSCGTDLISSSLGYTEFDDASFNHTYSQFYRNSTLVSMGASMAAKKGIIVTNSAGNDGAHAWKYLSFPADADSVCAVGAVNTEGAIASFSSYGYPGKQKPNIVSVGFQTVIANVTEPASGNGTSYSNPNIAGLIACLWQAFPRFNNMKILNTLYASADKIAAPDSLYGYGLPNMKTAYRTLKTEENQILYRNVTLWANPSTFIDTVAIRFIGQIDGNAKIEILNADQTVVATQNFLIEQQEVYNTLFSNLALLANGSYIVKYSDSLQTKTLQIQKAAVLPLSGLEASGRWVSKNVNIEWSTLAESNTSYFNILRSTNGIDFTPLTTVPAAGNSASKRMYSIKDAEAQHLQAKILYYQIVLVDKDNRKTFSYTIKLLTLPFSNKLVVYPNPARESVQLMLTSDITQPATIRLINQHGQLIKEQKADFVSGSNTVTISLAGFAKGEYLISVQTKKQTLHDKLMVH